MDVKDSGESHKKTVACGACLVLFEIDTRKGEPMQAYCPACEDLSNFYIARRQEKR